MLKNNYNFGVVKFYLKFNSFPIKFKIFNFERNVGKMALCEICPRGCNVDRKNVLGNCKAGKDVEIAHSCLHLFEEPCISGKKGSGAIFFSHCTLHCKYCQNYEISQLKNGKKVSKKELANIMLELQKIGAENINLVTPTSYVMEIIETIKLAKKQGLIIPIIYNTNGYEKVETLKKLEGLIDIYLPDFKYSNNELGKKFSNVSNYYEVTKKAIIEMKRQVGTPIVTQDGIMKKGLMIRHLILPNQVENSKKVLKWIEQEIGEDIWVSVMAQYFPTYKALEDPLLNRKITKNEYEQVEQYLYSLKLSNGYIQDLEDEEEKYVPKWSYV